MVRNVHERRIDAPAEVVGDLLDRLGGSDDPLWPAPAWVPMVLDRPLAVGADGGHGPVATLIASAGADLDLLDAWQVPWLPGMTTDPRQWAHLIFTDPPGWVGALLVARNALVRLIGVRPAPRTVFDVIAATDREALVGADDRHLDFRASVLVDPDDRSVILTTVTKVHNRRGRFYLWLVRRLHAPVVRGMLRRALHRLATDPPVSAVRP